jgi:hypothetical protein
MSNAALSVIQQVITIIMALMGVIVAWRPPKKETWQEYTIIGTFIALGLAGVALTYVQGHRLDVASVKQQGQLDTIQKNTEQSSPRAIIETLPASKPFLRKDGHVQVNALIENTGNRAVDAVWSSKLWVVWDSEVPQEAGPEAQFEDNLWKQLEEDSKNSISGSVGLGQPQIRSTIGDDVFSEDDFRAIEQGQRLVYLMAIIHYSDNHETDFCGFYWSQNKGNYQACKGHNLSH